MSASNEVPIRTGLRVKISTLQPSRIGPALFPGRKGIVLNDNPFGRGQQGGLWYVQLDPEPRAKACTETFWAEELLTFSLIEACADLDQAPNDAVLIAAHRAFGTQFTEPDAQAALSDALALATKRLCGIK